MFVVHFVFLRAWGRVCLCSSCRIDIALSKQKLSFSKALSLVYGTVCQSAMMH